MPMTMPPKTPGSTVSAGGIFTLSAKSELATAACSSRSGVA